MTERLPAFFEKYFDQKFGEVARDFEDLRRHVNDEVQLIRETIQRLERNQFRMMVVIGMIGFLFVFHDFLQGSVFGWLIKTMGI